MNNIANNMDALDSETRDKITQIISDNKVVLFMKGSADSPMCGFSMTVVQILSMLNVPFLDVNVLEDNEIREGIKQYSDWPTIPQLYIAGQFVGGCDIVKDAYGSGELEEILQEAGV